MFSVNQAFESAYEFAKGFAGGAAAMFASFPMNKIKIDLQQAASVKKSPHNPAPSARQILKQYLGQPSRLYAGITPFAITIGATLGVQNASEHWMKQAPYLQHPVVSSGFGGILSAFTNCPAEYVIAQMQHRGENAVTPIIRQTMNRGGYALLFGALPMTILREGGFAGICLGGGRIVNHRLSQFQFFNEHPALRLLASSALVAIPGVCATQAVDGLKTRQQTEDISAKEAWRRILNEVREHHREQHYPRFFTDRIPQVSKLLPVSAETLTRYFYNARAVQILYTGTLARFSYITPAIYTMHKTMEVIDAHRQHYSKGGPRP